MNALKRFHNLIREKKTSTALAELESFLQQDRPLIHFGTGSSVKEARDFSLTAFRMFCANPKYDYLAHRLHKKIIQEGLGNAATCNAYLQCIVVSQSGAGHVQTSKSASSTSDTNSSVVPFDQVKEVLAWMQANGLQRDSYTYQSLFELHYRAGYDVLGVWEEMKRNKVEPTIASLRTVLAHATMVHWNSRFIVDVVQTMAHVNALERNVLSEIIQNLAMYEHASPDQIWFLVKELEQLCILEKSLLKDCLSNSTLITILVKCAQRGEVDVAEHLLGVLERHQYPRGSDLYAVMVYCYATASRWRESLDILQDMSDQNLVTAPEDLSKRYTFDVPTKASLEQHYMVAISRSISTSTSVLDEAFYYLENKLKATGNVEGGDSSSQGVSKRLRSVSIHCLDVITLACANLHDEQRAIETVESYEKFGHKPTVTTYMYLLLSCGGKNKGRHQRTIYDAMIRNGVFPTLALLKVLTRQALAVENIAEAIEYMDQAEHHVSQPDAELLELVIEKAARVGDAKLMEDIVTRAFHTWNILLNVQRLHKYAHSMSRVSGVDVTSLEKVIELHRTSTVTNVESTCR